LLEVMEQNESTYSNEETKGFLNPHHEKSEVRSLFNVRQFFNYKWWLKYIAMIISGVIVGIMITVLVYFSDHAEDFQKKILAGSIFWPLLVLPVSLTLISIVCHLVPGTAGGGTPPVKAFLSFIKEIDLQDDMGSPSRFSEIWHGGPTNGVLSLKIAIVKWILSFGSLFSGASVGIEGTSSQISASIHHLFGRLIEFTNEEMESAIIAASAVAIGLCFSSPLAGLTFAFEELFLSRFEAHKGIIVCSFAAGVSVLYCWFPPTSFELPVQNFNLNHILGGLLCGLCGGFLGGLFNVLLIYLNDFRSFLDSKFPKIQIFIAFLCGVLLALIGIGMKGTTYGDGRVEIDELFEEAESGRIVLNYITILFPFAKITANLLSILSGIPGGFFVATFAVGSGLGRFASVLFSFIPAILAIQLSMVSFFSGTMQKTPITSVLLVTAISGYFINDYFPLLLASWIASCIGNFVCSTTSYHEGSKRYLDKMRLP